MRRTSSRPWRPRRSACSSASTAWGSPPLRCSSMRTPVSCSIVTARVCAATSWISRAMRRRSAARASRARSASAARSSDSSRVCSASRPRWRTSPCTDTHVRNVPTDSDSQPSGSVTSRYEAQLTSAIPSATRPARSLPVYVTQPTASGRNSVATAPSRTTLRYATGMATPVTSTTTRQPHADQLERPQQSNAPDRRQSSRQWRGLVGTGPSVDQHRQHQQPGDNPDQRRPHPARLDLARHVPRCQHPTAPRPPVEASS